MNYNEDIIKFYHAGVLIETVDSSFAPPVGSLIVLVDERQENPQDWTVEKVSFNTEYNPLIQRTSMVCIIELKPVEARGES